MAETKTRQSNFELLRIIAMLEIIGGHYFFHCGGVTNASTLGRLFFYTGLFTCGNTSVGIYMLLTGWFMLSSTFSWKKAFRLFATYLFYSLLCLAIAFFTNRSSFIKTK